MKTKKGGRTTPPKDKLHLRFLGDRILEQVSFGVITDGSGFAHPEHLQREPFRKNVMTTLNTMIRILDQHQAVGLAAPQIGSRLRMLVWDVGAGQQGHLLDGWVGDYSPETRTYIEACLSIPGLYLEIERPREVLVHGYDIDGDEIKIEADGLLATVLQHELDHLQGMTMIDILDEKSPQRAAAVSWLIKQEPDKIPIPTLVRPNGDIRTSW